MNRLLMFLLIGIIIVVVVALIAAAGSPANNSNPYTSSGKTCTATITADVGVESILIMNQNIPARMTVQVTELPFSFNFTENDVLSFNATSKEGFRFNIWWHLDEGRFYNNNPFTFKATRNFRMEARTLTLEMWQHEP